MEKDLLKQLNESLGSSEIDINEESFKDEYGKVNIVYSEREGRDFDIFKKVFYFEKYDKYYAIQGYYSSYDGTDFSSEKFYEVAPKKVEVIQYHSI
jgi:hypothetical protein